VEGGECGRGKEARRSLVESDKKSAFFWGEGDQNPRGTWVAISKELKKGGINETKYLSKKKSSCKLSQKEAR